MKTASSSRRIGLISPCSGNLGDAAILSSLIDNIRSRISNAEIIGITLSPEDTLRRHRIEAFPITDTERAHYYSPPPPAIFNSYSQPSAPNSSLRDGLKKIRLLRALVRGAKALRSEVTHAVKSARLIRSLDSVFVAGGGALDDFWGGAWGHPWALFKFALLSRMYRVPFYVVSVGKCALESPLSRFFVRTALGFATYRSYRDCDSKASVQSIYRSPDDPVCPDLAFSFGPPDPRMNNRTAAPSSRLLVGVSPIAYCDPRVWPLKDEHRYLRYVSELAKLVEWIIAQGHLILMFASDTPDVEVIRDVHLLLAARSVNTREIEILQGPPTQTAEGLLKGIARTDVVVASRLHGVILSHIIAKPVLAISYDRKVEAHMRESGQSEFCANIDTMDANLLVERFAALELDRAKATNRLQDLADFRRREVDTQYDLLLGMALDNSFVESNKTELCSQERS